MSEWSKEIPDNDGIYLCRFDGSDDHKEWEIIEVYMTDDGARDENGGHLLDCISWKAEWLFVPIDD